MACRQNRKSWRIQALFSVSRRCPARPCALRRLKNEVLREAMEQARHELACSDFGQGRPEAGGQWFSVGVL